MTQDTFETIVIPTEISGDKIPYLKEGEIVTVQYFEGNPINVALPIKVELRVVSTPPGIKGDTATGGSKPATLATGLVIHVPLFIKEGDIIRINTETGQYVERVN